MRRSMLAATILFLFGADDFGAAALRELLPTEERIPDPSVRPEPGARLTLETNDTPAAKSAEHLAYFMKYLGAGDRVGVDRLLKDEGVAMLPKGTSLLVLRNHRPAPPQRRLQSGLSGTEAGRQMQNDILNGGSDKTDYPVEVRITDGPRKDQTAYIPESFLAQTKLRPPPQAFLHVFRGKKESRYETFKRPALIDPPGDPEGKADALLEAGKRLERKGDVSGAVGAYWFAMIEHRTLPQAKEAARQLKALGFYRVALAYHLDFSKRSK
jgi:hypothetical protein